MRRAVFLFLFSFLLIQGISGQTKLTWNDFADVEFVPKYNAIYDTNFLVPTFGEKIKKYQYKEVKITGYFLDISGTGEIYLVSANPMSSCFFCGAAGPETIIEVEFKNKPPFKTDQVITVTGLLQLNPDDVDHCNYILQDATGILMK